jgi:3'(2'), 5'-bisphosphate nucleotidase
MKAEPKRRRPLSAQCCILDMDAQARNQLATQFGTIASQAGAFIMSIYRGGPKVTTKPDGSPVSDADIGAERLIREQLAKLLPGVPVLGEEAFDPARPPVLPELFLAVDPLDGTREFVNRSDEFTVNIALIASGQPIVGCVYAPARDLMFVAGASAFRADLAPGATVPEFDALHAIRTSAYPKNLRAVASRSHLDPRSQAVLEKLNVVSTCSAGSSLKFCVIAQGDADVYPRLAPTMEWDTAAGHAVLVAAGGCVMDQRGVPLSYGKVAAGFRNDGFIAWGGEPLIRQVCDE